MAAQVTVRVDFVEADEPTLGDALTRWLRVLPMLLVAGPATVLGVLLAFAIGACVVVTGRRPEALVRIQVWVVRVRVRGFSWFWLMRTERPGFPAGGFVDAGDDPHTEVTAQPVAELARWQPFARLLLAVPLGLVGLVVGLVLDVSYPIAVVVAGVRGGWSPRFGRFLAAVEEWTARVFLYLYLASDETLALVPPLPGRVS